MTKSGGNQRLTKRKRTEAPGNDNHEANAADKGKGKEPQSSAAGDEIKKVSATNFFYLNRPLTRHLI